jgi:hypothetical protein
MKSLYWESVSATGKTLEENTFDQSRFSRKSRKSRCILGV